MKLKRLWQTFRLCTISSSRKRAQYLGKNGIFAGVGENVVFMNRIIPLYARLIKLHSNIIVASNVLFVTHDAINNVLLKTKNPDKPALPENVGCIEIMDNVFVGADSIILYGTRIGPNAIVAAGSIVTKAYRPAQSLQAHLRRLSEASMTLSNAPMRWGK